MRAGMFEFLNVYPNPSTGEFSVSFANGSKRSVEIQVIDANGKVVYSIVKDSDLAGIHTVNMDASNLPKGNYFIRLISEGQALSKPVVLE
jgi:flagellar hook assembly protein FlgD